jgi:hypothetical protein
MTTPLEIVFEINRVEEHLKTLKTTLSNYQPNPSNVLKYIVDKATERGITRDINLNEYTDFNINGGEYIDYGDMRKRYTDAVVCSWKYNNIEYGATLYDDSTIVLRVESKYTEYDYIRTARTQRELNIDLNVVEYLPFNILNQLLESRANNYKNLVDNIHVFFGDPEYFGAKGGGLSYSQKNGLRK